MADRVTIAVVQPDLLGTYGDIGNALVMAQRAKWRGIAAEVIVAAIDDDLPGDGGIILLGGAEDEAQAALCAADSPLRRTLASAVDRGGVVFAVCAGLQMLGRSFTAGGRRVAGLGLIDAESGPMERRAVGEILTESTIDGSALTGFENHAGGTLLGSGCAPLGRLRKGSGNGDGRTDGVASGRVFGTYLHGPALARNPALADHLLSIPLGPLAALDVPEVDVAREFWLHELNADAGDGAARWDRLRGRRPGRPILLRPDALD